jgi:uncharacterized protein YqeY
MPPEAGKIATLINQQIVAAMKAHAADRLSTLRLAKTALQMKSIEKIAQLTEAEEQSVLASLIKQRRDSIEQYTKGDRPELAAHEAAEIPVLEEFLPKTLDEAALAKLVSETIAEVTAQQGRALAPKDMGLIMKPVQAKIQATGARAEGKAVSELVKKSLAG